MKQTYPGRPYHNLTLNYTFSYLTERLEQYLAIVEMQRDGLMERLYRARAFRRRGLSQLFERDAQQIEKEHLASPFGMPAGTCSIICCTMSDSATASCSAAKGRTILPTWARRWAIFFCSTTSAGPALAHPCCSARRRPTPSSVYRRRDARHRPIPALALLYNNWRVLQNPDDEQAFHLLNQLWAQHPALFPPSESRDIHMAAINFCIRRQNRGEREYARKALDLYRSALERGILLENGVLPAYTYNNIHFLAQVTGDTAWAQDFLDRYRDTLPSAERDNIYRYNLAIFYYRAADYGWALELLRTLDFPGGFLWRSTCAACCSKVISNGRMAVAGFPARQLRDFYPAAKKPGLPPREAHCNLIRFTRKLAKKGPGKALAMQIRACPEVAEREWLLGKI